MQKRNAIIVGIIAVALLTGGGAYAYFSDTEKSTGNSITAGSMDLVVDNQNPWTATEINIANVVPDDTAHTYTMHLQNIGSTSGVLHFVITDITQTGGTYYEPEGLQSADTGQLGANLQWTAWIDANHNGVIDGSEVAFYAPGLLSGMTAGYNLGALPGAGETWVSISFVCPHTAGNDIMGDTLGFSIEYTLAQP